MSKTKSYENGIKSMITEIKNQIHQSLRQNRLQIVEVKKFDFEIKSNLLSIRSNHRKSNENQSTQSNYSREKQSKRRLTLQPLRNKISRSPKIIQESLRKDQIENKERLMKKKKLEIKPWTISTTNPTD
ncbi:unnamed protein product [Paramecium primaurelia]|uniref:Uncharacterized protein n=1 Tax=Paramecium primaurelia TaxID=5886 RepID=A0A8S1PDY9_PARPR|nr:unnamed protein product [Paramecium primaurelia]